METERRAFVIDKDILPDLYRVAGYEKKKAALAGKKFAEVDGLGDIVSEGIRRETARRLKRSRITLSINNDIKTFDARQRAYLFDIIQGTARCFDPAVVVFEESEIVFLECREVAADELNDLLPDILKDAIAEVSEPDMDKWTSPDEMQRMIAQERQVKAAKNKK